MLIFLTAVLFLGMFALAILLITKGANSWKTVAEGHLVDARFIEHPVPEPPFFYSQDHLVLPRGETVLRFADGRECRLPGAFLEHARRGPVRLERNWLGLYRLVDFTP